MEKILPKMTTTTAPFWEGCREGELRLQRCNACGRCQFYPRILCSHCQHRELDWITASGEGVIASFTVVHMGVSDAYPAPYIVALIDLAEGPRMMSHVIQVEPESLNVGDRVRVEFQAWSEDVTLPVFGVC